MGNGCCTESDKKEEDSNFRITKPENRAATRATIHSSFMEDEEAYDTKPSLIKLENPEDHKPSSPIQPISQENVINPLVNQRRTALIRQPNTAPSETSHLPHIGPFKYPNGETYLGQYNYGKREGFGQEILTDGSIYEGCWSNDLKNGNGRLISVDGSVYTGEWVNNQRHGQGAVQLADGSGYKGEWSMDQITGKGRKKWPDGKIYQGDFVNGKKHGCGNFVWTDGNKYDGHYKNDVRDGFGKLTW